MTFPNISFFHMIVNYWTGPLIIFQNLLKYVYGESEQKPIVNQNKSKSEQSIYRKYKYVKEAPDVIFCNQKTKKLVIYRNSQRVSEWTWAHWVVSSPCTNHGEMRKKNRM
jgi:hypothetical protein